MSETKAIFLSYASEDSEAARRIAEALRGFGVEVWFDQEELRGGDAWDAHIRDQIKECSLFLPIISAQTQSRAEGYFRREWKLADSRTEDMGRRRAFLVPVCIDDTKDSEADVPDSFLRVQWTRMPGGRPSPDFVTRVVQLLEAPSAGSGASKNVGPPLSATPTAERKGVPAWAWAAVGLVVVIGLAVAFLGRSSRILPAEQAPSEASREGRAEPAPALAKSIAVLPLDNRSDLKEDEYFTDGIHDDLLTQISRIRDIKTISRTSVMAYRDTTKNMREIGEELGVATILEGGVQRAGDQIRINVQLIDAATDAHLWAETYTREMTVSNIFAIQSEIATAIAGELKAVLSPEEQEQLQKLPTENLAALELFFKAVARGNTAESVREGIEYLKQAIELDPDFGLAHGSLSRAYLYQIWSEGLPVDEQLIKAEPHIHRALELDPTDSNIQVAWAGYNIRKGDNAAAQAALERAIELNPNNARAYDLSSWFQLWYLRNPSSAVDLGRKAVELNPVSIGARKSLAEALLIAGRFHESEALLRELKIEKPRDFDILRIFGNLQREAFNRYDEAIKAYRRALSLDPENQYVSIHLATSYQALGDRGQAAFWWSYALEQAPNSRNAIYVRGMLHRLAGEDEEALATLRELEEGDPYFGSALSNIVATELRLGRPGEAMNYLLEKRPDLNEPGLVLNQDNIGFSAQLARAQLQANQQTQATALVEQIPAVAPKLVRMGTFGFFAADADLYAAAGDYDRALAALRELLIDAGACSSELANGSEWDPLRSDPEFQELMAINQSRLDEQRANLAKMEENGELAPIPPLPSEAE